MKTAAVTRIRKIRSAVLELTSSEGCLRVPRLSRRSLSSRRYTLTRDSEIMGDDSNFREAFQLFDQDQDGVVSAAELKKMMKSMGNELTEQEVRDILKEAGSTTSISYPAFARLMGVGIKSSRDDDPEDQMRDAYKIFDVDGDGKISPKDMVKALAQFGVKLNDSEVDKVRAAAHALFAALPPPCSPLCVLTTSRSQLIAEATLSNERNVTYEVFKRVMSAAR